MPRRAAHPGMPALGASSKNPPYQKAAGAGRAPPRPVMTARQLRAHTVPLSVNEAGALFVAPLPAMNPTLTEPAAGMFAV